MKLEERTQEVSAQLEQKEQLQMTLEERAQEVSAHLEQEKQLQTQLDRRTEEVSTHLETIVKLVRLGCCFAIKAYSKL